MKIFKFFLFSIFLLIFLIPSVFLSPFTLALIKNDESSFINPAVKESGLSETAYYKIWCEENEYGGRTFTNEEEKQVALSRCMDAELRVDFVGVTFIPILGIIGLVFIAITIIHTIWFIWWLRKSYGKS